jgi:hypothetical protein
MAGRSSGRYVASHPSWHRKQRGFQWNRNHQSDFENRTFADIRPFGSDTLQRHYPLLDESPYSQPPTIQSKLEELRILAAKFSFPEDAHKISEWANIRLRQGDEEFLNNKLEQLRMLDR